VHERICARLGWLGIELDATANNASSESIAARESKVDIWIIPTSEETTIARDCMAVLAC
jgi:acetate kinase